MWNIESTRNNRETPVNSPEALKERVFQKYKIDMVWLILYGSDSTWESLKENPERYKKFIWLTPSWRDQLMRQWESFLKDGIFDNTPILNEFKRIKKSDITWMLNFFVSMPNLRDGLRNDANMNAYWKWMLWSTSRTIAPIDLCSAVNSDFLQNRGSLIQNPSTGDCLILYLIKDKQWVMKMHIFNPLDFDEKL